MAKIDDNVKIPLSNGTMPSARASFPDMEALQDALAIGEQSGRSLLSIDEIFAKALKRYELNNG